VLSTSHFFSADQVKLAVANRVITFVFYFLVSANLVQDFGERYSSIDRHTTGFERQTTYPRKYNTNYAYVRGGLSHLGFVDQYQHENTLLPCIPGDQGSILAVYHPSKDIKGCHQRLGKTYPRGH